MKIKINKGISKIEFWALGEEVAKVAVGSDKKELLVYAFNKPRLTVDTAKIAALPSVQRDLLIKLLEFHWRVTEYDNVDVGWSDTKYPDVWSPSIDTVLFARALNKLFSSKDYLKSINSFLEIGCGSGFLSKFIISKKFKSEGNIKYAHLMDINQDALTCAMDNIKDMQGGTEVVYSLNKPNESLKISRTYDLVVCNPPYISRPGARTNNPFEGLFLYGEILKNARKMLTPDSKLVINFSSISKKEVFPYYKKIFDIKIIDRMKVPLKIPLITGKLSLASKKWMDYLEKNKKLIVDPSEKSGYRYWQIIEIAECKLKPRS